MSGVAAAGMSPELSQVYMLLMANQNMGQQGQTQQTQGQQMSQMPQMPLFLTGNAMVASGLQGLANWYGGKQQRKYASQQMGRQTDLYNLFRYGGNLGRDVIGPTALSRMLGQWRQSMEPTFRQSAAGAARMGSLSSPDIRAMLLRARMGPEAGYAGNLMLQNVMMKEARDTQLRNLLARLAGV